MDVLNYDKTNFIHNLVLGIKSYISNPIYVYREREIIKFKPNILLKDTRLQSLRWIVK